MIETLVLPAEITIYVAAELRTSWLAWMDGLAEDEPEPVIDGRAVEEVDAAGLQCLLALSRSLRARNQQLRLRQPSDTLRQACRRLGLKPLLAEAEGAPA